MRIVLATLTFAGIALSANPVAAQDFQSGQAADALIGKPNFTIATPGTASATNLGLAVATVIDPVSGKVFVSDYDNNRVVRFASVSDAITGQAAEIAFGQPDLVSSAANNGGLSATSLDQPNGLFIDSSGRLWVADRMNHRILRYDAATADPPTLATRTADGVLGQPDFATNSSGDGATELQRPAGLWIEPNGALWVADDFNNRVLRFNSAAALPNGAAATIVLGQTGFDLSSGGTSQLKMNNPTALCMDSTGRLWVAESLNSRVLRFDFASFIGTNGVGASGVLGQANFQSSEIATSSARFFLCSGVTIDPSGRLFVADLNNNRVLWFDQAAALPNGASASGVLGQPDFTTADSTLSASGVAAPQGLHLDASGALWVADGGHRRILRFQPVDPPTPTPPPTLAATGKTKLTTSRPRVVLKGTATNSTLIEFQFDKTGFKPAKGSAANWKVPVRLTKNRTVIKVRATGPGGTSKILKFTVTRK